MKEFLRFEMEVNSGIIRGRAVGDFDSADIAGVIALERVVFDTPEDEETWRDYDRACGGDGTGAVRVFVSECVFLGGVVPSDDQPTLGVEVES